MRSIRIITALYYVAYFGFLVSLFDNIWKYALGLVPLSLLIITIMVCIERIKEIERGEEDDLSQY